MSDTDGDGDRDATAIQPSEAFALLGDRTRVAILRVLFESWEDAGIDIDYGLSFSELRERVGMDHSGQFNYHLDRVAGHYVRKTDAGYVFTPAGWRVVRAVVDGTYHERPALDPFEADGPCYHCGAEVLRVEYVNEWVWITCGECGGHVQDVPFPAAAYEEMARAELLAACDRRRRRAARLLGEETCPECLGDASRRIGEQRWGPDAWTRFAFECTVCDHRTHPPLGRHLLEHPDVVSFYADRGVDVATEHHWTFGPAVSDEFVTVVSQDPWRFRAEWPAADAELLTTVDDTLAVVDVAIRDEPTHETGFRAEE